MGGFPRLVVLRFRGFWAVSNKPCFYVVAGRLEMNEHRALGCRRAARVVTFGWRVPMAASRALVPSAENDGHRTGVDHR